PVRGRPGRPAAGGERAEGALGEGGKRVRPISQPSVSQLRRMLRYAGVFTVRAEGSRRYYALDPAAVQVTRRWLEALLDPLAPLANPLDALETELARGARAARRAGSASQTEAGVRRGAQPV